MNIFSSSTDVMMYGGVFSYKPIRALFDLRVTAEYFSRPQPLTTCNVACSDKTFLNFTFRFKMRVASVWRV